MKNEVILIMAALLCGLSFFAVPAQAKYGGGTGEPNDPYLIYDANQMNAIGADSNDWDKHFRLMADINLADYTGTQFNIIGNSTTKFTGVFDGSGHKISNFSYTSTGTHNIGLFGYVADPNAEIRDLGLLNPDVDGGTGRYVGSLVGATENGSIISCCYAKAGSVSGDWAIGALVGFNGSCSPDGCSGGMISNCYSTASVSGNWYVGGLVGGNNSGIITNCYSVGSVEGAEKAAGGLVGGNSGTITNCYSAGSASGRHWAGGLVGMNFSNATITNSYSTGDASGDQYVGGLVGFNEFGTITNCYSEASVEGDRFVGGLVGYNRGTITNCYSETDVSGTRYFVGGLVGENYYGTITNCYSAGNVSGEGRIGGLVGSNRKGKVLNSFWDIETSGQIRSAGGTGKTTAEMMMESTFFGWGMCEGLWTINEGIDYPRLAWEEKPGQPIVGTFPLQGDGDSNSPYLINTPEELNTIGLFPCVWDKHFKVMADINLSQYTGTDFNIIAYFKGVFEGNGYTISNFTYSSSGRNEIGIFGLVDGGEIKNLGLIDPDVYVGTHLVGSLVGIVLNGAITNCYAEGGSVEGGYEVGGLVGGNRGTISNCYSETDVSGNGYSIGGLVGHNWAGTITNCYSTGSVAGTRTRVGGLVGGNSGTITNCYASSTVSGDERVGGLVGYNGSDGTITNSYSTGSVAGNAGVGGLVGTNSGSITNCYSTGTVSGDRRVGGLMGTNSGSITNCYSTASISGDEFVGGLVGFNYDTITNCYSAGSVSGDDDVGGLVGYQGEGEITGSFWDIETSGQTSSDGGTGLPTAEMQMASTFINAGWDFVGETANGTDDIWYIREGVDYPRLWWENYIPVACIVGGDRIVECEGCWGARVTLDGSCSSDADSAAGTNDDIVHFDWYKVDACDPNFEDFIGSGEIIDFNLPLGEHIIVLEVIDKVGAFDTNEVTIIVRDTTPPELALSVTPTTLWPANHKMVLITPTWKVSDICDDSPEVSLVSITMNEGEETTGEGHTNDDIQVDDNGLIYLRAERSGAGSGRIYTITYQAVDDSGNAAVASATVTVPHDQR